MQAAHQMTLGRVWPYVPRTPHTKAIAERIRAFLAELGSLRPTVRGLFYDLVTHKLIEKTEKGYKLVQEQQARMRKGGYIPMDSVIDGSRRATEWRFYARPSDALLEGAKDYASDPWLEQPEAYELWLEAETHREMLRPVAAEFGVPIVATHGFSSLSEMNKRAEVIRRRWEQRGQRTHILWVGDHDPAGLDLSRNLHARLVELHMPPQACVVERIALTYEQIRQRKPPLPSRPPKKGDTRTPRYEEEFPGLGAIELDALPPQELVAVVRAALWAGVKDRAAWARYHEREQEERWRLIRFVEGHRDAIDGTVLGVVEEEDTDEDQG